MPNDGQQQSYGRRTTLRVLRTNTQTKPIPVVRRRPLAQW
jgi:uncharacterized RDD family membrane protein YckC